MLRSAASLATVAFVVAACNNKPAEPAPPPPPPPTPASSAAATAPSSATTTTTTSGESAAAGPGVVQHGGKDPLDGKWTLADATKGLPGTGPLMAAIDTDMGTLDCKLFDDKAPNTVANFVGLARGLRPFQDPKSPAGDWVKRPAYDGTTFHRIIKGFMIQGGDPKGTGTGEPGYVIKDEIWPGAKHDKAGLLCMANRGHDTNGMQFFVTDAAAAHLDGNYTIFGQCTPEDVVHKIASVPVKGDHPDTPPVIKSVKITRLTMKY